MSDVRSEKTRSAILTKGLEMWLENPDSVTAHGIATNIGISHATVLYHFPQRVKDAVAEYAVQQGCGGVIAQLIVTKHPAVSGFSPAERAEWLSRL
jgi:AcrR family transcriptional regulator